MQEVVNCPASRVQLTTDGLKSYLEAVEGAFGPEVDKAMLKKILRHGAQGERCYSLAESSGAKVETIQGVSDPWHVSTSYVERANLTMRKDIRLFAQLTNAFSKKVENHIASIELHFMIYNWVRPHGSLKIKRDNKITPAMAAGIARRPWTLEQVVALIDPRI